MLALLAAVGALVVALLLWRSFAGQRIGVTSAPRRAPLAPDDDPDFLRGIDQRKRREDEELLRRWEDDLRRREDELRKKEDTPPADS